MGACTDGSVRGDCGSTHDDPEQLSLQVASFSVQEDSAVVSLVDACELSPAPLFNQRAGGHEGVELAVLGLHLQLSGSVFAERVFRDQGQSKL